MLSLRQSQIITFLQIESLSSNELFRKLSAKQKISEITIKRDLKNLLELGFIVKSGNARSTRYSLGPAYEIICPVNVDKYFEDDIDERECLNTFQFAIFDLLLQTEIFNTNEIEQLNRSMKEHTEQAKELSSFLIKREFERLSIEFSWKSSAIEGNTYSLLETETLLTEGVFAEGKKSEDAQMILNHKVALDFIRKHAIDFKKLSVRQIEEIHHLLVDKLDVTKRIRKKLVSITGTTYRPLDNEFQIREALEKTCVLINKKKNVFEKALLATLLISYIQPFEDGNKRTARLVSMAILLAVSAPPLSYRSTKINDYKMAILLFYEKNNISAFKKIFIEQIEFAVKTYFRAGH